MLFFKRAREAGGREERFGVRRKIVIFIDSTHRNPVVLNL